MPSSAADVVGAPTRSRRPSRESRATLPPLRGVIHAAGVLDDGALAAPGLGPLRARAGAQGRRRLAPPRADARATDLDLFVLFSSVASLLGSPGQANHAAANAYLDALAHHRRARGPARRSASTGARGPRSAPPRASDRERRIQLQGLGAMTPAEGLAALRSRSTTATPRSAACRWTGPRLPAAVRAARRRALAARRACSAPAPRRRGPRAGPALARAPGRGRPRPGERRCSPRTWRAQVARVLGLDDRGALDDAGR